MISFYSPLNLTFVGNQPPNFVEFVDENCPLLPRGELVLSKWTAWLYFGPFWSTTWYQNVVQIYNLQPPRQTYRTFLSNYVYIHTSLPNLSACQLGWCSHGHASYIPCEERMLDKIQGLDDLSRQNNHLRSVHYKQSPCDCFHWSLIVAWSGEWH